MPRFVTSNDYEVYAENSLDQPTYDYVKNINSSNVTDFSLIKLKARGLANMKQFENICTTILGHKFDSPIAMSPLPL